MRTAVMLVLVLGCGGSQKTTDPAMEPVTEEQCREMAGHMLDVQIASRPPADRPSGKQETEIREGILADFVPSCATEVRQPTYECWMAAQTIAAFETCAGRTRNEPGRAGR